MKRSVLLCIVGLLTAVTAYGADFVEQSSLSLPDLQYGSVAWAPYDTASTASGKSVLALSGLTASGEFKTYVYWIAQGSGGQPAIASGGETNIPGVVFGSMDFADFDRDGDLDLAIAGRTGSIVDEHATLITEIYRNVNGTFEKFERIPYDIEKMDSCVVRWVDYNVDGFVDLYVTGRIRTHATQNGVYYPIANSATLFLQNVVGSQGVSHSFVEDEGQTSRITDITAVHGGGADWADVDDNGNPDLVLTGMNVFQAQGGDAYWDDITEIYLNGPDGLDPGTMSIDLMANITALYDGSAAWGDYNRDGRPDLAVCGRVMKDPPGYPSGADTEIILEVWENLGSGNFQKASIGVDNTLAVAGQLQWGDLNNDGWLDLVMMGENNSSTGVFRILANDQDGTFSVMPFDSPLTGLSGARFTLGHVNTDGLTDIVALGTPASGSAETHCWALDRGGEVNNPPVRPEISAPIVMGNRVDFFWDRTTDDNSGRALTYELLMYTSGGALKVFSNRAAFGPGPQGQALSFRLHRALPPAPGLPLFVRAIDASGHTSEWSVGKTPNIDDFVESPDYVVPIETAAAAWADVNLDGYPDLIVSGRPSGEQATAVSRLYLNDNGVLKPDTTFLSPNRPGVMQGDIALGDVNGDGYPDLFMSGSLNSNARTTRLYINENGRFPSGTLYYRLTDLYATGSSVDMGDIDNDGDIDLVVMGQKQQDDGSQSFILGLGVNDGVDSLGNRIIVTRRIEVRPAGSEFQGFPDGDLTLVDYDLDGDLDISVQGTDSWSDPDGFYYYDGYFEVFRNDGDLNFVRSEAWWDPREFTPPDNTAEVTSIAVGDTLLDQLAQGEHAWADIDGDRDLDLIVIGWSGVCSEFVGTLHLSYGGFDYDPSALRIYENDNGTLRMAQADSGLYFASLFVADVDNDNDVDIVINGFNDHDLNTDVLAGEPSLRLYLNNGNGSFTRDQLGLFNDYGSAAGSVRAADYDCDGDLDFVSVGRTGTPGGNVIPFGKIFSNTNSSSLANVAPSAPTGLTATVDTTDKMAFMWDTDITYPTYTLRVGTSAGAGDIRPGVEMAGPGQLGTRNSAWIGGLADNVYYWTVQAVDNGWARSDWATVQVDTIDTTPPHIVGILGDTLSSAGTGYVTLILDMDDALTGVDTLNTEISVSVDLVGEVGVAVERLRWGPGETWYGQCSVAASRFLTEPVTVHVQNVKDRRGNTLADTSFTTRITFTEATRISSEQGGRVANSTGTISVYVPPGALSADIGLALEEPAAGTLPVGPDGTSPVMAVRVATDETITELASPAILTMNPLVAGVAQVSDLSTLNIFRLSGAEWQFVGGSAEETAASETAGEIRAPITQFGVFALFPASGSVTGATLDDLRCTPRVFSPGSDQGYSDHTDITFTVAAADAGEAQIMVYNNAGRKLNDFRRTVAVGRNTIAWDGQTAWNSRVASGLYIVVVKVNGIQKTMTVAVLNKYAN